MVIGTELRILGNIGMGFAVGSGDCAVTYRNQDGIAFIKSLPDQSIDGVFTDPPWGKGPAIQGQANWKGLLRSLDRELPRVLKPKARVLVWMGMRMLSDTCKAFRNLSYVWTTFCYYIPPRYIAGFESSMDPIILLMRPGDPLPMRDHRIRALYQHVSRGKSDTLHPCARPFITVKQMLRDWFDEGEMVVDPFAGSDSTGVACRLLNLKYESCEIDPEMFVYGQARHAELLPLDFGKH